MLRASLLAIAFTMLAAVSLHSAPPNARLDWQHARCRTCNHKIQMTQSLANALHQDRVDGEKLKSQLRTLTKCTSQAPGTSNEYGACYLKWTWVYK